MAAIDYYSDITRAGEYQYISLEQVVFDYMMARVDDDLTAMVDRNKIIYHAKRGFRELYYDILKEIKIVKQDLNPNSLTITVPPDYVNWVRVSWVDEEGRLRPMAENRGAMKIGNDYLQDHEYEFLYDDEGCVLLGSDSNPELDNVDSQVISEAVSSDYNRYIVCTPLFNPNMNTSELFPNGFFKIYNGIFYFSSSVGGKEIVLEYISDGLFIGCEGGDESDIKIHKFAEGAIHDYIYYELIKNRHKVAQGEKQRARKEYYNSERKASRRMNAIRKEQLLQDFKGDSKWIK